MCTTLSCTEQWAGRGHASPRSIFPPLKRCVPAQSGKQNPSAHKPNQHPHSLKHIIRMEWHLKAHSTSSRLHGILLKTPRRDTTTLRIKVAVPRCCPQFTWQEESHARIAPDSSLFECTPTEHVKKTPARKMAIKYVKS
ncbi:hypothetical protein TcCL_NonESM11316 [Trypanosoma cruzi]|nr:hypothetical protein TcCL_NonESM11316 [Trypanosoma cruzi]